jgi:DNA repair exonuclease SbcCD ATPase subunit
MSRVSRRRIESDDSRLHDTEERLKAALKDIQKREDQLQAVENDVEKLSKQISSVDVKAKDVADDEAKKNEAKFLSKEHELQALNDKLESCQKATAKATGAAKKSKEQLQAAEEKLRNCLHEKENYQNESRRLYLRVLTLQGKLVAQTHKEARKSRTREEEFKVLKEKFELLENEHSAIVATKPLYKPVKPFDPKYANATCVSSEALKKSSSSHTIGGAAKIIQSKVKLMISDVHEQKC